MKEYFYIDLERRADALKKYEAQLQEEKLDKSQYSCFNMHFPNRECRPVERRRTLAQVWKLIEETSDE